MPPQVSSVRDLSRAAPPRAAAPPRPRIPQARLYEAGSTLLQALISLVSLVILSPLFAVIALLIKLSSPGPVFYRGERVGRRLRRFTIYKFRTMVDGTEAQIGPRLLTDEDKYRYCTRIGRVLKRTKLDELPQLINVLKGDMRLVGPRPVRPVFLERFMTEIPNYALRFLVPPGMTGVAQLRGGYYTSPRNKLRYDLVYIRNRSFLLDLWLVILTFVKVLNRWLSMGMFALFLFLFASFIPVAFHPVLTVPALGVSLALPTLVIVGLAAWIFVRQGPAQLSLYRSPLNLPILLFVALTVVSTALAEQPSLALRGSAYYVVTGFLTAFVIVNTLATARFITWTVRLIALTSAVISLLGLFEMFQANQTAAAGAGGAAWVPVRATSILDSPPALAVYLVLGIPLLLAEVTSARTQGQRDFWLACTTISFVGVFLTQTRVGLVALLVTGTVFLYRRRRGVRAFLGIFLVGVVLLVSLGLPRFSARGIVHEVTGWVETAARGMDRSPRQWLIGSGAGSTAELVRQAAVPPAAGGAAPARRSGISNMHVTLILEHGLLGWCVVMWLIVSTIVAIKQAHDRVRDERLKTLLWAIVSSLVGYLVSMNSMNTFHHLPIQVFFWSLIGIGLGIVTHTVAPRSQNLIWRFGDAGD